MDCSRPADVDARVQKFNQIVEQIQQRSKETAIENEMCHKNIDKTMEKLFLLKTKERNLSHENEKHVKNITKLESNLKIAITSRKVLEDKLKDCTATIEKTVKQDLENLMIENKTLKNLLKTSEAEKYELERTVESLTMKNNCNEIYKTDIVNQQTKIKAQIDQLSKEFQILDGVEKALYGFVKDIEKYKSVLQATTIYREELIALKNEKREIEEQMIFYKVKTEQMTEMMTKSENIPRETQFFFDQWKKSNKIFGQQLQSQQDVINNIAIQLRNEKEGNARLIQQEYEYKKNVEALTMQKTSSVSAETQTYAENSN